MARPCIAINATMLASSVRIDTRFEAHIGTIIVIDDGSGLVVKKLSGAWPLIRGIPLGITLEMNLFETIGGIFGCPSAFDGWGLVVHSIHISSMPRFFKKHSGHLGLNRCISELLASILKWAARSTA